MARDLHFSFLKSTQTGSGAYLYYPVGAGVFFLRVKQVGQEADLSPSFTAEFPNLTSANCYLWDHRNRVSTGDKLCQLIELTVTAVWCMPGIFQDTGNSWHHRAHLCIVTTFSESCVNILWIVRSSSVESDFLMLPVPPDKAPVAIFLYQLYGFILGVGHNTYMNFM